MLQRKDLILKFVCCVAGAALLYQAAHLVFRGDSLRNVKIPRLPSITNAVSAEFAASTPGVPGPGGSKVQPQGTNTGRALTNSATVASNGVHVATKSKAAGTNVTTIRSKSVSTNVTVKLTKTLETSTNQAASNTNVLVSATNSATGSNMTAQLPRSASMAGGPGGRPMMPGMMPGMAGGPGGRGPELPKQVKVRVERVTDSEMLAPVVRPMPMALLGIAGNDVFLRTANGQSGLIKQGDSLGGVKLLKIGINRVLVEEEGQSKELTIFSGMGSESLMPTVKTNL